MRGKALKRQKEEGDLGVLFESFLRKEPERKGEELREKTESFSPFSFNPKVG